jgi:HAD superfamily hydrolase (TIGR01509 family)
MSKNETYGALFDMDGVLVHSNPFHLRAWRELTGRYGLHLTGDRLRFGLGGRLNKDIVEHFWGPLPQERNFALGQEKEAIWRRLAADGLECVPGLQFFLNDLQNCGFLCGVATSAPRENLEFVLKRFHLRRYFAAQVVAEDVTRGKPDPQVYQIAAGKLGIPPQRCIVFEDAVAGIEAGHRAGALCIGITTTRTADELIAAGAMRAASDFTTVSAEFVLDRLRAQTLP